MSNPKSDQQTLDAICRVTILGAVVNLLLVGLKIAGGIWGNSQVLIADAIHSLSDLVTDFAVIVGARYWTLPADENHPHGHAKIETLVTLFIGVALGLLGMKLTFDAIHSLPGYWAVADDAALPKTPTVLALAAALVSIGVKEWLYRITLRTGRQIRSTATIANAWHHRSDALSSIPAAIAVGACLVLGPKYAFLDAVGTIIVAVMIMYAAWQIIHPTFRILSDIGASHEKIATIRELVADCPGVKDPHEIRTRYIGDDAMEVTLHVLVDPAMTVAEAHSLADKVEEKLLSSELDIVDVIVHVEPWMEAPENEGNEDE